MTGIDLRRANAWVAADKANINNAVAALPGGFDGLNRKVREALLLQVAMEVHRVGELDIKRCSVSGAGDRAEALGDATRVAVALAWGSDDEGCVVLLESALLATAQAASVAAVGAGLAELSVAGAGSQPPPPATNTGYVSSLAHTVTIEDLVAVPTTPAEGAVVSAQICLALMRRHLARPPLTDGLEAILGVPLAHLAEVADSSNRFLPGTRVGLQRDVNRECGVPHSLSLLLR